MATSSMADRVRRNGIMDQFCGTTMTYEPVNDFHFDANIYNDKEKHVGIAKIYSKPGNFGNSPIVEIPVAELNFLYELGVLTHKKPAIIVKFRNKIAYLKLESLDYGTAEGKKGTVYKVPIGLFRAL